MRSSLPFSTVFWDCAQAKRGGIAHGDGYRPAGSRRVFEQGDAVGKSIFKTRDALKCFLRS